jgi:hypothetical protein
MTLDLNVALTFPFTCDQNFMIIGHILKHGETLVCKHLENWRLVRILKMPNQDMKRGGIKRVNLLLIIRLSPLSPTLLTSALPSK